jgi:hypothetical protein
MRFGLFGSGTARRCGPDAELGHGCKHFFEYNIEAEALGYLSSSLRHDFAFALAAVGQTGHGGEAAL